MKWKIRKNSIIAQQHAGYTFTESDDRVSSLVMNPHKRFGGNCQPMVIGNGICAHTANMAVAVAESMWPLIGVKWVETAQKLVANNYWRCHEACAFGIHHNDTKKCWYCERNKEEHHESPEVVDVIKAAVTGWLDQDKD